MALIPAPSETVREKILKELERRLDEIESHITGRGILVERGHAGSDITQLPKILIFEDTETAIEDRRGFYAKTLPVQVEYFRSVSNPEQVYVQGNRMIAEINRAVEQDERFFPDAQRAACPSITKQGRGLVKQYRQTRNEIVELTNNRAIAIVWYEFQYWDCRIGVVNPPACS